MTTALTELDALLTKVLNSRVGVEQELFDMAAGKKPMPDAAKLRELAVRLGDPKARPEAAAPAGEVVVTKNSTGQIVAVTRQDEEGRVLSVIAQSEVATAPAGGVTDVAAFVQAVEYARDHGWPTDARESLERIASGVRKRAALTTAARRQSRPVG